MKLHSIVMINSGNFSFAHLTLDANSIQLSGKNNKGKTSLLWTLPLLFVVDRRQATHPNYMPKESLNFYFKSPERSYIIFEGYDERQGYFYMLLRRDGESIKYHFAKKKFDLSFFMRYSDQSQSYEVLPFSRVMENPETGIGAPLKDQREILARAITSQKGEVGFLRLSKEGSSKQFSALYKHLFQLSGDNEVLKNGILIVNGLKEEALNMKDELQPSTVAEWRRERSEIDILKGVQEELDDLKAKRNEMESKRARLVSKLTAFEKIDFAGVYKLVIAAEKKYEAQLGELNRKREAIKSEQDAIGERMHDIILKSGGVGVEIEKLIATIAKIEEYPDEIWLKQALSNAEAEHAEVRALIESISTAGSLQEVERRLKRLHSRKRDIEQFVNHNEETLMMNLSGDKREIGIMHTVLNDAVTSLPKTAILSGETHSEEGVFTYNGARIDISTLPIVEVPTIEERKRELSEVEREIERTNAVKENFREKEKLEERKKRIDAQRLEIHAQILDMGRLPEYKKELTAKKEENAKLERAIEAEKERLSAIKEQGQKTLNDIRHIEDKKASLLEQENEIKIFYNNYLSYCDEAGFSPSPSSEPLPSIDSLYGMIEARKGEMESAYGAFDTARKIYAEAERLVKSHVGRVNLYDDTTADIREDDLVALLEQKCRYVDIREKELNDKMLATSGIFSGRVKRFMEQLETVKKYTMRINKILSGYTISDLAGIHIRFVPNEKQVSELDQLCVSEPTLFAQDILDEKHDEIISRYIRTEKTVELSSLFEIALERTKKSAENKKERRERSKQSNGTEKMLSVMLLLILLREMIHPDDAIPFLIDEVMDIDDSNQGELLKFFQKLNLLPISASPRVAHAFDKVYFIEEEDDGSSYINENTCSQKEFAERR